MGNEWSVSDLMDTDCEHGTMYKQYMFADITGKAVTGKSGIRGNCYYRKYVDKNYEREIRFRFEYAPQSKNRGQQKCKWSFGWKRGDEKPVKGSAWIEWDANTVGSEYVERSVLNRSVWCSECGRCRLLPRQVLDLVTEVGALSVHDRMYILWHMEMEQDQTMLIQSEQKPYPVILKLLDGAWLWVACPPKERMIHVMPTFHHSLKDRLDHILRRFGTENSPDTEVDLRLFSSS